MGGLECRNLLFVFCRLKRAGGVKQTAIRLETEEGVLKNSALKIRKDADLFGLEPPAGVHPAAQDAGIGAGDIEKDAVEVAPPFDRGLGGPIEGSCSGYGKVLLSQVFGKPGEAFFVYVCAQQDAVVFHGGCNQGRFPTRGGAGVEDDFSGLWGEKFDRKPGRGILYVDQSFLHPLGREAVLQLVIAIDSDRGQCFHLFRTEGRRSQGVEPDDNGSRLVVP